MRKKKYSESENLKTNKPLRTLVVGENILIFLKVATPSTICEKVFLKALSLSFGTSIPLNKIK